MTKEAPRFHYLNTDLDLIAAVELSPLIEALESDGRLFSLHMTLGDDGFWYSTCETESQFDEPDANIVHMLDAIESLPDAARAIWDQCVTREFNPGYDCGAEPWGFNQGLSNETLRRMAAVGASFRFTLYPHRDDGDGCNVATLTAGDIQ
ncbi:hypothetical protein Pan258_16790 [Symmachiella dynata]|uniref:hypothetical protein n=1 Tax=Symmachiella dynata TaxID=2527995 RepID=UPI0011881687|nr:hypothetical protein [Symmachiella dynata]QDT47643.1 hypothetical protein Pan258_16790 [Symmachiella dynata]